MKRYGWLFEKAFTKENISLAIIKASKGKRKRKVVQRVLNNKDYYVDEIYNMIWNGEFKPTPYIEKEITDGITGKVRQLSIPKFYPDHIIHWCIYLVLYPILKRSLIHNTCSSLKGRGQVYGKKICEKKLRIRRKTKYYLKLDIRKFYPSVNNDILMMLLERKIKDPKMLALIKSILDMAKGLPIGMILSQLFANFYLYEIDHDYDSHIYVRYADDIVIFSGNKRTLHRLKDSLTKSLDGLDLAMKDNWQIYKTDKEMLDYMGYRMNHVKTIIRKSIMIRTTRAVRRFVKHENYRNACAVVSYMGWVKNSNSYTFYQERIKPYVNFTRAKRLIRKGKDNESLQK